MSDIKQTIIIMDAVKYCHANGIRICDYERWLDDKSRWNPYKNIMLESWRAIATTEQARQEAVAGFAKKILAEVAA